MQNKVQDGDVVDLPAPYDRTSGQFGLIGAITTSQIGGVAVTTISSGNTGPFALTGVYDLDCLTTATFSAGDAVYWDNTNKRCTNVAASNYKIGFATAAKISGPATVRVRLNGTM